MRGLPHFFKHGGMWYCHVGNRYYGGWSELPFGEYMPPTDSVYS